VYYQCTLPSADEITATIEGIGSITPIIEARFEEWVEIWKKYVMVGRVLWDMGIPLS
jgi:hypothetical protein